MARGNRPFLQNLLLQVVPVNRPSIVLEGHQTLIKHGVDMRRQHDAVVPVQALEVAAVLPWFDVARAQEALVGDPRDAAGRMF